MKRHYTQTEIYNLLKANPTNTLVNIGDLEDLQGNDYIFLDFLNDIAIPYDNNALYQTALQITIATKSFETRKTLVKYIKSIFMSAPTYTKDNEFEYYLAQFTICVFLKDETLSV